MSTLKVSLIQANQIWEDKVANLNHYAELVEELEHTDLIVFPEMFQTCFSMNASVLAEEMDNSLGIQWLQKIAKEKNAACYTSLIILENKHYFNRGVFVYPDGGLRYYDKRKRFALAGEDAVFEMGTEEVIVIYKDWKINLQICYDLRFPENIRNTLVNGEARYDVLIYVANWPKKRAHHWKSLLLARAIENQCYVIGVNRVGTDGMGFDYSGNSIIIDALGNSLTHLEENQEVVSTATISKEELTTIRISLPFLIDSK